MNLLTRTAVAAWVLAAVASPCAAGEVKLQFRDGFVTVDARDATLSEILAEWGRVGQTRIVNGDRAPGEAMTLRLNGVTEQAALATLLRATPGFIAAPRAVAQAAGSMYDRIALMPGSRPAAVPRTLVASPPTQPAWNRGMPLIQPQPAAVVDDQDEPVLQRGPQGQPGSPASPSGMPAAPTAPPGVNPYGIAPGSSNQGSPYMSPYGTPYGNSATQGPPAASGPGAKTTAPANAVRPGMPTAPAAPAKNPGGTGGPGGD
jgi:hypothetical protein